MNLWKQQFKYSYFSILYVYIQMISLKCYSTMACQWTVHRHFSLQYEFEYVNLINIISFIPKWAGAAYLNQLRNFINP